MRLITAVVSLPPYKVLLGNARRTPQKVAVPQKKLRNCPWGQPDTLTFQRGLDVENVFFFQSWEPVLYIFL